MKFIQTIMCNKCAGTGKVAKINPAELRRRRIAADLSLREVADKIGCSKMFLSDIETGKRNPNAGVVAFYRKLK